MSAFPVHLPDGRWDWARATAAVGLLQALAFADRFLLSLTAVPVARALHLDDLQLGLLQGSAFILPFAVATAVFGRLGDGLPARRLLLAGLAAWTVATAWSGVAATPASLYGARVLLAVGEAAVGPVGLALIARAAPRERAAVATSIFSGAGPLGKGLALLGGGGLLALFAVHPLGTAPWRTVFLAAAALNLALAPPLWRWLREREAPAPPARRNGPDRPGRRLLTGWDVAVLGAAGCAAVLASQTLGAWAPAHLHRAYGLSVASAGAAAGAPLMLASPLGGVAMATLLDRGRRGIGLDARHGLAVAVSLVLAAAAAGLAFGGAPEAVALAGYVLLTAALGAAITAFLAAMQLRQPAGRRAEFASWVVVVPNLVGFGVGPALAGWLSSSAGGSGDALRWALLAVIGGACLIGAAAATVAEAMALPRSETRRT